MHEDSTRRKPASDGGGAVHELLAALGFTARERIPICTRIPGEPFRSRLYEVSDLAGWSPPQDRDVWFGVNPVGRHVRQGRKGGEGDITRVRALFADFDVKPGKSLDTLDQCHAAAWTLADYLGVAQVALIESGHGLQPIWRVGSPRGDSNVIDRDRCRDEVREIWWRFGAVAQDAARSALWSPDGAQNARTIDGVFNLDRVLRCPGSVNWKNPDEPVPVRTRLYVGGRVGLRGLVARLDRDGVRPLAAVRPTDVTVETSWGEATEWVTRQPGACLDLDEVRQLPASRILGAYLDPANLVRLIADGDGGAHRTMVAKVLHAVYSAQEGRAGLVVALNNIGCAYLEVMEARAGGEMAGDARPLPTAIREIESAVAGAVAKARGRALPRTTGRHPRRPAAPRRPMRGRCA
ncbi:hypothetical protein [Mycolicibacter arupensis]|nr:hypothetical protein [Mycolicibacter arupensis]